MSDKVKYLLLIFTAWAGFGIWEYYVQQWAAAQPPGGGAVIRVDLVLLFPVLLLITGWSLYQIFRKRNPSA